MTAAAETNRIKRIAVVLMVALILLPCAYFLLRNEMRRETLQSFVRHQALLVEQAGHDLEETLAALARGLQRLAAPPPPGQDPRIVHEQLSLLFQASPPLISRLALHDSATGLLLQYPEGPAPSKFSTLPPNPPPLLIRGLGEDVLQMFCFHSESRFAAALISTTELHAFLARAARRTPHEFLLFDSSGEILWSSRDQFSDPQRQAPADGNHSDLSELAGQIRRGETWARFLDHPGAATHLGRSDLLSYIPVQIYGHRWLLVARAAQSALLPWTYSDLSQLATHAGGALLGLILTLTLVIGMRRQAALAGQLESSHERSERLQRDLDLAQRRAQQLFHHAGDALFYLDPATGTLLQVNRQAEEMFGYSEKEIRNQSLSILFPGRHERRYLRLVRRVLRDGYGEEPDLHFRCRDGRRLIGAVHARLGQLGDDRVVHGVIRDVTRVREAEQDLRRKNRELTLLNEIARHIAGRRGLDEVLQAILEEVISVFEAHGGGIFLLRDEGATLQLCAHRNIEPEVLADLRRVSPGLGLAGRVAASGQPQSSADVQNDQRVRSKAAPAAGWRGFQAIPLTAQEKTAGVLFLFNRDRRVLNREELHLLLAIGQQVGSAVQGAEIFEALRWQNRLTRASNRELERSRTQLGENLEQARRSNRELATLDRMKSNFMALASHELRTPLTCVISGVQYLRQVLAGRIDGDEEQLLDAVMQGGNRLDTIVQDMLEAARLESNSLYLAREKIDLAHILRDLQTEFQPIMAERQLNFWLRELPVGVELTGDAYHLKRTFSRLVENAVKYTPAGGGIEILSRLRCFAELQGEKELLAVFSTTFFTDTLGGPLVQITVRDDGIGIAPDEHLRVFDKFYEVGDIDQHSTSQTRFGGKGVGLGLTLVKGMVEAHGGMVWLESPGSRQGAGSAFHVLLPVSLSPPGGDPHGS